MEFQRMIQSYFTDMTNEEFASFGVKTARWCGMTSNLERVGSKAYREAAESKNHVTVKVLNSYKITNLRRR